MEIHCPLRIPSAVRYHEERAAVAAVAVLVPAVQIHRHAGTETAKGVAELVDGIGRHARDADETFVDEGLALKDHRLRERAAAAEGESQRRKGDERNRAASS